MEKRIKPKADFSLTLGCIPAMLRATKPVLSERQYKELCMGNIPAMLRATKSVLSERQYNELCNEVNKADGYLEQKRIIFSYVDPIIKG